MVININKLNKIKLTYQFLGKFTRNSYKSFFYKRNNFSIFKNNGKFNISKCEFSIIRYLKHLMQAKKKWKNFQYKRRYLGKKTYKKSFARVKTYIQKNFLTESEQNHTKIKVLYTNNELDSMPVLALSEHLNYILNMYETLYLKMRIIEKIIYNPQEDL